MVFFCHPTVVAGLLIVAWYLRTSLDTCSSSRGVVYLESYLRGGSHFTSPPFDCSCTQPSVVVAAHRLDWCTLPGALT